MPSHRKQRSRSAPDSVQPVRPPHCSCSQKSGMSQQSGPQPQSATAAPTPAATATATSSGLQEEPKRDPRSSSGSIPPCGSRGRRRPGGHEGRRAVPPTTQPQSEPIVNTSCAGGLGATQSLQRGAGSEDPSTSHHHHHHHHHGSDGPAAAHRALRTNTRASAPSSLSPFPPARPLPRPPHAGARQAPHLPLRSRGPSGGGATLGRGVAAGLDARTRSRTLRLRVGPRDAHPESPP